MANEINFSARLTVAKSGISLGIDSTKAADMSGDQALGNVQIISTTTEALVLGDVSTIGYLFLKNNDPTNFVEVGLSTPVSGANAMATLKPGEFTFIPTRQTTIYAKADTANINLYVLATEL